MLAADPELSRPTTAARGPQGRRIADPVSPSTAQAIGLDASLLSARGVRQVVVRLSEESVSEVAADGPAAAAQRRALGEVKAQQDRFIATSAGDA